MITYNSQRGIGLVEVMVALLLLAIAVLGFSSLQLQAVKATDESLTRSTAVSAMRNLSEDLRLNTPEKRLYFDNISRVWKVEDIDEKTVAKYCERVETFGMPACTTGTCTSEQQANYNSYKSMKTVCDASMMMNAIPCPQNSGNPRSFDEGSTLLPKLCLIVSWGDTLPEADDDDAKACLNDSGAYKRGSSCLVMETY